VAASAVAFAVLPGSEAVARAVPASPVLLAPAGPVPGSPVPPPAPVPPAAASSNAMAMAPAADGSDANPIVGEDTARRGRYWKTFTMTDGSYDAVTYLFPVHFQSNGTWRDIDNTLTPATDSTDGTSVFANTANPTGVRFAKKSTPNKLVSMTVGANTVSWHLDGQAKVDATADEAATVESGATVNQKKLALPKIASGVTYAGILPGVDVRYVTVKKRSDKVGAWSGGLYANDVTADVRDAYMGLLQDQVGNEAAYERTLAQFDEYIGDEDEPLVWYALADTMWKTGRLTPEVKARALAWIGRSGGLAVWLESATRGAGWRKTLASLKAELESPQPPEKKVRKPVEFVRNPWNVGDVYAYQFHTDLAARHGLGGWFIPFQKVGNTEYCNNKVFSAIQVYDHVFPDTPTMEDLVGVRILPLVPVRSSGGRRESGEAYVFPLSRFLVVYMIYDKRSHYPAPHLTFVGAEPIRDTDYPGNAIESFFWERDGMEEWLIPYYLGWHGVEY